MRTLQVASQLAAIAAAAMVVVITVARAGDENARSRVWRRRFWLTWLTVLPLGAYDFVSDTRHLPGLPLGLAVLKDLLTLAELSFALRYWRSLDERDPPRRKRRRLPARRLRQAWKAARMLSAFAAAPRSVGMPSISSVVRNSE